MGHLLGSIVQSPLSQHTYFRVRTVLLALADMLASLASAMSCAPDVAERMRAYVNRIDNYMAEAALSQRPVPVDGTKTGKYRPLLRTVSFPWFST